MLKISRLADYAVLVLSLLAKDADAYKPVSILAAKSGLPEPTVSKVLKLLGRGGLVESLRGAVGGYRLARSALSITVSDIVTAIEGPIAITACTDGSGEDCQLSGHCALTGRWNPVNRAIKTALENVTLADMMKPGGMVSAPLRNTVLEARR